MMPPVLLILHSLSLTLILNKHPLNKPQILREGPQDIAGCADKRIGGCKDGRQTSADKSKKK